MDTLQTSEDEQAINWNGQAGKGWVAMQALLDHMFQPIQDLLVQSVLPEPGLHVLDIGCGTGGTTLAVARRLGEGGHCVGVDISAAMIGAARRRAQLEASSATFLIDDAQTHAFEAASFDRVISRFGVMFFDDFVGAFANLRRASQPGAALDMVVWRSAEENPFMTTAERAASALLPNLPVRRPGEPGQFGLADPHQVRQILEASAWGSIDIEQLDVPCAFPEAQLVPYFTQLGPLGRVLPGVDEPTRRQVIDTVCTAFAPHVHGAEVRFNAACWRLRARAV
ncbi:MAG: class I SAM-dependent methyltransferase [Rubrivivax sp.]|nr:MAG: class I SAM-dependent methyltransferase [Rubrivivax sp.]